MEATIAAKAATTRISVRYEKMMKSCFALFDIFTGNDFTDGFALMADRGKKRAEIMDTAEEDAANQYPEGDRQQPNMAAPIRPRDGSRTGNG